MKFLKKKKKYEPLLMKKRKINLRKIRKTRKELPIIKIITNFILFIMSIYILLNYKPKKIKMPRKKLSSNTTIAMCVIVEGENRYIKYFVDYYFKLGYNHIYIYDHNQEGGEVLSDNEIIKEGVKNGSITIIPYRDATGNFITESYYDCVDKFSGLYDWISFFDIDEYLILEPRDSYIQEFMDNPRYNNCELVKFNWKVFTDNDQLDFVDKALMERFPIETGFKIENRHVKSIVRGKLNYSRFRRNGSPHSVFSEIKACSVSGKSTDWKYYLYPPDYKFGWLNHYVTKSVREFFYKKFKNKVDVNTIPEGTKRYLFGYFFSVNKKTKEKVDIFNQIFNTNYH